MEGKRIFDKCPDVIERELNGEVVLLDSNTGIYYSLNEIGAEVWRMLDGKKSAGEIAAWVADNYEVGREEAAGDVGELLEDLLKEKLIREAAA